LFLQLLLLNIMFSRSNKDDRHQPIYYNYQVEKDGILLWRAKLSYDEVIEKIKGLPDFDQFGHGGEHWVCRFMGKKYSVSPGISRAILEEKEYSYPPGRFNPVREFLKVSRNFPQSLILRILATDNFRRTVALAALKNLGEEEFIKQCDKFVQPLKEENNEEEESW